MGLRRYGPSGCPNAPDRTPPPTGRGSRARNVARGHRNRARERGSARPCAILDSPARTRNRLELRAQLDVIRRRGLLIALSVLIATAVAVGLTAALPRNYRAEASLVIGNAAGAASPTLDQVLLSQRISVTYA